MECSFKASGLLSFFLIFISFLMNFTKLLLLDARLCKDVTGELPFICHHIDWVLKFCLYMCHYIDWVLKKATIQVLIVPQHLWNDKKWCCTKTFCMISGFNEVQKERNILYDVLSLRNQNIFGNSICWNCNQAPEEK